MTVNLDSAIDSADSFSALDEILQDAEVNLVVDTQWHWRQVTSPRHSGFIELADLANRVSNQFQSEGCLAEDREALEHVSERVESWIKQTDFAQIVMISGIEVGKINAYAREYIAFCNLPPESFSQIFKTGSLDPLIDQGQITQETANILRTHMEWRIKMNEVLEDLEEDIENPSFEDRVKALVDNNVVSQKHAQIYLDDLKVYDSLHFESFLDDLDNL